MSSGGNDGKKGSKVKKDSILSLVDLASVSKQKAAIACLLYLTSYLTHTYDRGAPLYSRLSAGTGQGGIKGWPLT